MRHRRHKRGLLYSYSLGFSSVHSNTIRSATRFSSIISPNQNSTGSVHGTMFMQRHGAKMQDNIIIDRIRRERTARQPRRVSLRIEEPMPTQPTQRERVPQEEKSDRGVAIIDFTV